MSLFRKWFTSKKNGENPVEDISTSANQFNIDLEESDFNNLINNLKFTIARTNNLVTSFDFEKGNYGTVFRTLNPIIGNKRLYNIEGNYSTWNIDMFAFESYKIALEELLKTNSFLTIENTLVIEGRILLFETSISTHDGAPIVESDGFVDESDAPPIDTWFYLKEPFDVNDKFSNGTLFCWIPSKFERKMQDAIDVEILDSYDWLDEVSPKLNEQIIGRLRSKE